MTTVRNLATDEERAYSLPPEEAVLAAYAQARGDWATWEYPEKYGHLLIHGEMTVGCGDWCAFTREGSD